MLAGQINPLLNLIVLPLLLVGLPWVILRSRRFHLHMTSWRGMRFGFHGDYKGAFKAYILKDRERWAKVVKQGNIRAE